MKILIKVTKEILMRSCGCGVHTVSPKVIRENCAVALAVRDIFPKAEVFAFGIVIDPAVNQKIFKNDFQSGYDIYWGKGDVSKWITSFDCSSPNERVALPEFSFEVDVPEKVIDQIGIGEVYRILSESKTLELVSI